MEDSATTHIENLGAALVREYLYRKGLRNTLIYMDKEYPRAKESINSRSLLARKLSIVCLMKRNRTLPTPFRTMIEMIVHQMQESSSLKCEKQKFCRPADINFTFQDIVDLGYLGTAEHRQFIPRPLDLRDDCLPATPGYRGRSSRERGSREEEPPCNSPPPRTVPIPAPSRPHEEPGSAESVLRAKEKILLSSLSESNADYDQQDNRHRLGGRLKSRLTALQNQHLTEHALLLDNMRHTTSSLQRGYCTDLDDKIRSLESIHNEAQVSNTPASLQRSYCIEQREQDSLADIKERLKSLESINDDIKPNKTSVPLQGDYDSETEKAALNMPAPLQQAFDNNGSMPTLSSPTALQRGYCIESDETGLTQPAPLQRGYGSEREGPILTTSALLQQVYDNERHEPTHSSPAILQRGYCEDTDVATLTNQLMSINDETLENNNGTDKYMPTAPTNDWFYQPSVVMHASEGDVDNHQATDWENNPLTSRKHKFDVTGVADLDVEAVGQALKVVVLGSVAASFSQQWLHQSFCFNPHRKLKYGFLQTKGGCCGVLAPVQATLIKFLLFEEDCCCSTDPLRPTTSEVRAAFVKAVTEILWRAGGHRTASLVLSDTRSNDDIMASLRILSFSSMTSLAESVRENLTQFTTPRSPGCLLLVFSAVLSRGISSVVGDMDEATPLIGSGGQCPLEMVNLLLTGFAVSNVHDNSVQVDSCLLRGVPARADVGFLSLFEHYNSCQVGSYLKTPRYPIWVVCSDEHFTVLFSCKRELVSDWRAEKKFNLFYYDTMDKQTDEIKLTIDTTDLTGKSKGSKKMVPPLEHCIRTKWKGAQVEWGGSKPLF